MITEMRLYDPFVASISEPRHVSGYKELQDIALTALFELRGKMRIKQTKDGSEAVTSGLKSKPAARIEAVPIIHRDKNEVRHIDFSPSNAGALNRMIGVMEGNWRFATPDEEAKAEAQWTVERREIQKAKDKALTLPAELIGQQIGKKLAEFADNAA